MKYSTSAKLHHRANKAGKRVIYATYSYDRQTITIPTALEIADDAWDQKNKKATPGTTDALHINTKLAQIQSDIMEVAADNPKHEVVKRRYGDLAHQRSKAAFAGKLDLSIGIVEHQEIGDMEQQLQHRKDALAPMLPKLAKIGIGSGSAPVVNKGVKELEDLFLLKLMRQS